MTGVENILLQPRPTGPTEALNSRPKGLLDQLLEKGRIQRDLVMSGRTFQVSTTFLYDPDQASFFRCTVSREGEELTQAPWQPIFRKLTEAAASTTARAARQKFAQQALETHLALCQRLEGQLEEKGGLAQRSILRTPVSWTYFAAIFTLVATASGWYGFERWRLRIPEEPTAALALASETSADPFWDDPAPQTDEVEIEGTGSPAPDPRLIASQDDEAAAIPTANPPKQPQQVVRRKPSSITRQPVEAPPPARQQATTQDAKSAAPLPRSPPSPTAKKAGTPPSMIVEVVPRDHQIFSLKEGVQIYSDASIRVSEFPSAYRNLSCVTTTSRQGDTEQGILLRLSRPARVFVMHDLQVKKKPDWLTRFRASNDKLRALEVDRGRTLKYKIYWRDVEAGAVALGSNTGAKAVTKRLRGFIPKNRLAMYLVCVSKAPGATAASEGGR